MKTVIRIASAVFCFTVLAPQQALPSQSRDDGEVYRIGNGVSAPMVIKKVEPEYAPEAKAARIEGGVLLEIVVTKEGTPEISWAKPNGLKNKDTGAPSADDLGLVAKAREAMSQWRFKPSYRNGQAVNVRATVEMNFRLQ